MRYSLFFLGCSSLWSLPQNPNLVSGDFRLFQADSLIEIIAADRTILNWDDFSVANGERVVFALPDDSCRILNRVIGGTESLIYGEVSCNGGLLVINPAGIVFGPNAKVDTFSMIATSLDLQDFDFLRGEEWLFFSSDSKGIRNEGMLQTINDIYLIAPCVVQDGFVNSEKGDAIFAACEGAVLNGPDGKFKLLPGQIKELKEEGVCCGGVVNALKARLYADGNLSSLAINLTGLIDADEVEAQVLNGALFLDGAIKANQIDVKGKWIDLGSNAEIDVSSEMSGGSCRIHASEWISVSPTAEINASSKEKGNGGDVFVYSEKTTLFQGSILANARFGNGGLVEVSGAQLFYKGSVSTQSEFGKTGTLILDPLDIAITNTGSALINGLPNGPFSPMASACYPGPGNAILEDADLINALLATNVVITTVGTSGACPGDIIFDETAATTYNSTNSLTLSAEGSIHFESSLINMGAGAISITQAGADVNVIASDTPISVESNGGPISITGVSGDLNISGGVLVGCFARISAPNASLNVSVGGDINITGGAANGTNADLQNSAAPLTILNAADIRVTGGTVSNAPASIFSGSGGDLTITCDSLTLDTTASGASVAVSGDNDTVVNVTNGDLQVLADGGGLALLNGSFAITATVSNDIIVTGNGGGFAMIFGDRESATLQATNGSVILNGATQIYSGNLPFQNLLVIAGTSILANGNNTFDVFSPTGTLTLVVDNLFPSFPGVGGGQFVLSSMSQVNAMGNQLQIFAASPIQNSIQGSLNGGPFAPGIDNERFGFYYPDPFFVSDYVVFYKPPIDSAAEQAIVAVLQPEFADFAEFFRVLHPFSEYIYGSIRFNQSIQDPLVLLGISETAVDRFRLRKKSATRSWFELVYDPAKF